MASIAFVDPTIWVAGLDMTGDLNEVGLNVSVDELDSTTFGTTGYRARKGGLRTVEFTAGGFLDTSTIEPEVFPRLGTADRVVTIAPDGGETNTAYIFRSGLFQADLGGAIGDLAAVKLTSKGTDPQGLVRGQVAKASGTVNSTGVLGSVVNVGAVSASQYVYAAFHVFTAGTTITVQVQSDNASGFPSATTVATLGPLTTTGGTWLTRVAGPLTDTHWRFNVSAITGTFTVAGAIGIGS
jgi:hypothetical protein